MTTTERLNDMYTPEPLEEMIFQSLLRVTDVSVRTKLALNIVLCGGGSKIGE